MTWLWKLNNASNGNDDWQYYSDVEIAVLEKAYQNKEKSVDLGHCIVDLGQYLQFSKVDKSVQAKVKRNGDSKHNSHLHQKLHATQQATANVVFYSGEFREQIPIITQCLQVDDSIAAVIAGIRREGTILGQVPTANCIATEVEEKANNDDSMIGLHCMHQYTSPTFLSKSINKFLREEDSSKVETLGPFVKLLFSHFKEFPLKEDNMTVYRDLELDRSQIRDYRRYAGKGTFRWLGFSSTSKRQGVAEHFKGNTLMIIRLKQLYPDDGRAADIENLSWFPQEEEVLLRAGVEFSIEKVVHDREKKKYYICIDAYV